jgi:hypothetical protein
MTMNGCVRHPGELERAVVQIQPALAARLRLEALRAWGFDIRRVTVHPARADEEREDFIQRWIGARLEEALDITLRVAP